MMRSYCFSPAAFSTWLWVCLWDVKFSEGIVMGGGFLIHRFFNHFLVKEHEKPAEDQKKQETIFLDFRRK